VAAVAAGGRGAAAAPAARVRRRPPGRARRRRAPCSGAPQARLPCCYCFDSRRGNTTPIALLRALSRARGSILVCPVVTCSRCCRAGPRRRRLGGAMSGGSSRPWSGWACPPSPLPTSTGYVFDSPWTINYCLGSVVNFPKPEKKTHSWGLVVVTCVPDDILEL
jgi:hypothetical protein